MKGLELSERFFLTHGAPMLRSEFPHLEGLLAVGLAGSGSECFGFDDGISHDHDFEPGFCIFLPDEDLIDSRTEFALERAYAKLPREFMGYRRQPLSPVGGNRHGVIRMSDFFRDKTGTCDGSLTLRDWFFIPEQSLAEATNGKVFCDGLGKFSAIRQALAYLPEDVRLKKLAGELLLMGQAGQYNYPRCISRGDTAAAQLSMAEFVSHALHAIFLLNRRYLPYYKWSFRALRELPCLASLEGKLEFLISSANTPDEVLQKKDFTEQICASVTDRLRAQKLTAFAGDAMEGHAHEVNDRIRDADLRNLHILYGV
ncbi:MAG: DUF4037 domain-containing protein [Ruminococcaceae bacterium]|nr:DUF4037 domain-containing protein [Oscillospiraceae bacterium]